MEQIWQSLNTHQILLRQLNCVCLLEKYRDFLKFHRLHRGKQEPFVRESLCQLCCCIIGQEKSFAKTCTALQIWCAQVQYIHSWVITDNLRLGDCLTLVRMQCVLLSQRQWYLFLSFFFIVKKKIFFIFLFFILKKLSNEIWKKRVHFLISDHLYGIKKNECDHGNCCE